MRKLVIGGIFLACMLCCGSGVAQTSVVLPEKVTKDPGTAKENADGAEMPVPSTASPTPEAPAPDVVAEEEVSGLEEIIVTAQKTSSNLQQTPIAISALSGDALEDRQITDVEALLQSLPNVDFGASLGTARLSIRGIGFDNIAGGNEGRIAFHQDGVYYSRPASVLTGFYDIERIEVLRGPQGTLYGRNATGGVVNVITRDPGSSRNYLSATGGNYDLFRTEGGFGGSITDTLAARIAFQSEDRGGFGRNEFTGTPIDDRNTHAARGKLRWTPSDNLDIQLVGDYFSESDHANGYVFLQHSPTSAPPSALYPNPVSPQPLAGELFGGVAPTTPRNTSGDVDTQNDREFNGVSGTVRYEMGDTEITSISGYRESKLTVISDIDQTSAPIALIRQDENSRQVSEELRVSGHFSDKSDWLLGAYYFDEQLETGNRVPQNAAILPFFRTYDPNTACPTPMAPPAVVPPQGPRRACTAEDLADGYAQGFLPWGTVDTNAYALFGNLRYQFDDRWSLRVGLRYSDEKKKIDEVGLRDFTTPWPPFVSLDPFPPPPPPLGAPNFGNSYLAQKVEKSYDAVTSAVTLDYQHSTDLYLYALFSQGFKSGGFNVGGVQAPFDAETINDYEIGAKADWFNRRLRTNLAVFYYDYSNIQTSRVDAQQLIIFNAPGAVLQGAELEVQVQPLERLRLEGGVSWLESEYDGPFASVDSARPWLGSIDLAGKQLTQAPKRTATMAAQYGWSMPGGALSLRAETQYKSRIYFSAFNTPEVSQAANWASSAFASFDSARAPWSLSLYVRNIENNVVRVAASAAPSFWGTPIYGAYAPPRTYGLELRYSF